MATPAKSVQIRDTATVCKVYEMMKIPAWAIKQGSTVNWKYQGDSLEDGKAELRSYCELLEENETAAIYTLCLYEDLEGKITDKTPADLSNNFRFIDTVACGGPGDHYGGTYGTMLAEVKQLRKELQDLKNQPPEEANKLGMIGELMEMEALQPIIMGVANKVADWIMSPAKGVGEMKRVSGVPPGAIAGPSPAFAGNWREEPRISAALDVLAGSLTDLPEVLEQLGRYAVNKPKQFSLYKQMLLRTKF